MPNRIEQITKEAHRVNRERHARGLRHPEIHDTPEQEALTELFSEIGDQMKGGHPMMHVMHYVLLQNAATRLPEFVGLVRNH